MASVRTHAQRRQAALARLRAVACERAAIAAVQGPFVPETGLDALLATKRPFGGSIGALAARLATSVRLPPPPPAKSWDDLDD